MAYNDDRNFRKVGSGPAGRDAPLSKAPKSLVNPSGKNANYDSQMSMNKSNPLTLNKGDSAPMYRTGGLSSRGVPPGTPSVGGKTQIDRYTSHPFSGRGNMGGNGSNMGGKGGAKQWGNGKKNNAP